ncbi:MAG: DUF1896 domain-containing protein [Muribaculum sp.]|nr:DUF1896 domain-containing protein [Muribaculum sp.]
MTDYKVTREEEISFYFLYLKNYLTSYKFVGVSDTFIQARAELAEETYENARKNGAEVDEAHELSIAILLEGFRYSDYEIIMDVLEEEFYNDVSEDLRPFMATYLQSLGMVEDVFDSYDIQDSNFIPSGQYDQLRCELTGVISIILTENGL